MTEGTELVTVRIRSLPVALHARAQEHADELRRELRLLLEQLRDGGDGDVPARLIDLTRTLSAAYSGFTAGQEDQLQAAIAAGTPTIDLTFRLPGGAADAARALSALLDEADDYCRAGQHLLTLTTPEDLLAYRRWYLEEFIAQIGGASPTPWAGAVTHRAG